MEPSSRSLQALDSTAQPTRLPSGGASGSRSRALLAELLGSADVRVNGHRPWDMILQDGRTAARVLSEGSLGLGESYMDGWWDCAALDEMITRILEAHLEDQVSRRRLILLYIANRLFNRQNRARAWQVGRRHYDLGNDLFAAMLDSRMTYSCGYWATANTLEEAQRAKLDLVCRKLGLRPGMRLLDIGCGWGSLLRFAAEHYGARCVGLTISQEQAAHARECCAGLPVEIHLQDYRDFGVADEQCFDRIASIGMFEHVGHKNLAAYFAAARRWVRPDGLFLLHTIGKVGRRGVVDPWMDRYIFPNHELQSLADIATMCEGQFVIEDVENFGADYDRTLMSWHARLESARPSLGPHYDECFYRMMRYYLLASAAVFRSRTSQLWQLVLSPQGVAGGYRRPPPRLAWGPSTAI